MTHICVSEVTIIGSDNGLSPGRRQAIIWTNAGILLIGPLGTNFSEILFGIQTSSFNKMHLKMSSAKWRLFCLGLNVLTKHTAPNIMGKYFNYLCYILRHFLTAIKVNISISFYPILHLTFSRSVCCRVMGICNVFITILEVSELILGLRPANERLHCKVMSSLIGWA